MAALDLCLDAEQAAPALSRQVRDLSEFRGAWFCQI